MKLAEHFRTMSNAEKNKALKRSLDALATSLVDIERYRESHIIAKLQNNLLLRLKELDESCNVPTELLLKDRNTSVKSSLKFRDQFETLVSKPTTSQSKLDRKRLQLEVEEKRVYTIDRGLQQNLLKYERKRIDEMKAIMQDIVTGQLQFHCKAVESLSKTLKSIRKLDSSEAVEELCSDLHISAQHLSFEPAIPNAIR